MLNVSDLSAIISPNDHGIKSGDTVYYSLEGIALDSRLAKAIANTLQYISSFCNLTFQKIGIPDSNDFNYKPLIKFKGLRKQTAL